MQYSIFSSSTEDNLITVTVLTQDNNGSYTIDPSTSSDLLTAYENFRSVIGSYILSDITNTPDELEFYIYAPGATTTERYNVDYTTLSAEDKGFVDEFAALSIAQIIE